MPGKVKGQVIDTRSWASARLITIGEMARTFGCLPSEVDSRATTFDLMVYDVLMAWDQHKQDKQNGNLAPPNVSEEELLKILKKAKG